MSDILQSDDGDVMLALAVHELSKREPQFWVHNIYLKRDEKCCEFHQLYPFCKMRRNSVSILGL